LAEEFLEESDEGLLADAAESRFDGRTAVVGVAEGLLADADESRFDGRTAVVGVADLFLEGREADRDEDEA
jgi:hypothetical protein